MKYFLLMFCCLVIINFTLTDTIKNLNICLTTIIRNYFSKETVRIYVSEELCLEDEDSNKKAMMIPVSQSSCFDFTGISSVNALFEINETGVNITGKATNAIIFTNGSDLSDFNEITSRMKMTSVWNTRVLIVLYNDNKNEPTKELIFSELWRKTRLINTIIMDIDGRGHFKFYNWYPYEKNNCESMKTVKFFETWRPEGFLKGEILFPKSKILRGLNNCPVLTSTSPSHFFTVFEETPDENSDGLDLRIIRELVDKYNLRLIYKTPPFVLHHWNRTDHRGQLYGSMKLLYDYEIDLAFSGLKVVPEIVPFLPFSHIYFTETLQWSVPKGRLNQGWQKMVSVFPIELWMAVFTTFVICSIFMYFIIKFEKNPGCRKSYSYCLLESLSLTLTHPIIRIPQSLVVRSFLFGYLLYAFNISISYQSLLTGILTAPSYLNSYKSVKDAFERGLTIYLYPLSMELYQNDTLGEMMLNSNQFKPAYCAVSILSEIVHNKSAAFLLGHIRLLYLVAKEFHDKHGDPLVYVTPEIVTKNLIAFHFSPNHPLKGLFDDMIIRLTQGGFINKWKIDLLTPRGVVDDGEEELKALTMDNLEGIFQMYCISIGISTVVFICEVSVKWLKNFAKK